MIYGYLLRKILFLLDVYKRQFNNREVEKIAVKIKDRMEIIKSDSYKKKISDLIKNVMSWDYYTSVIEDIYKKCYEDSGIVIR